MLARFRSALQRVTERQSSAHDLLVCQDALVAIDQCGAVAAVLASRVNQRLENRAVRPRHIERNRLFAGSGGNPGNAHKSTLALFFFRRGGSAVAEPILRKIWPVVP